MTIKDIARKCGVGVSTVSRALNDHPDINPETKEKVLRAVAEDGFVPNNSARNLKRTDSRAIAIVVKDIDNPFFATMMRVMEKEICGERYTFFIQHVAQDQDEVDAALELVEEKRLRGIIFLGGYFRNHTERLKRIKVPFVVITADLPNETEAGCCSFVTIDNAEESRRITDYLCRNGHKKIAILAAAKADQNIGRMRLAGYQKALEEHNIPVREDLIRRLPETSSAYSMENGYRLMKSLLEQDNSFTAVYAISDLMAVGALRALAECGVKVPEDCAVAGFDGLDYGAYYTPALTTIVQPVQKMAEEAVRMLFEMIVSKAGRPGQYLPARLAVRQSTETVENEI